MDFCQDTLENKAWGGGTQIAVGAKLWNLDVEVHREWIEQKIEFWRRAKEDGVIPTQER